MLTAMFGAIVGGIVATAFAPEIMIVKMIIVFIIERAFSNKYKKSEPRFVDV